MGEEYWAIKSHHYHKYSILQKYIGACCIFQRKYRNFVYVETHGGSGLVFDTEKNELVPGSPIIARRTIDEEFPCYILEIRDDRFQKLCESLEKFPNVNPICGDCNKEIIGILSNIPNWKFKFLNFQYGNFFFGISNLEIFYRKFLIYILVIVVSLE